jgi:prepilin-type N-terminal cleavage/methylation domain-containing protein
MIFQKAINKTLRILRNERGFSLIEAIIAVTILSVGLMAMLGTTGTVMEKNDQSQKSSIAMTLAQDKIEYFKGIGGAWLLAGADTLASPDIVGGVWTANAAGETIDADGNAVVNGTYNRTWTISIVPGQNFLFDILVTMTWPDASGNRTLQLNTEVTQ